MNTNPITNIPKNEWDAIILSIIKPFMPLCNADNLITVEDLQQESWIGLLRAAEKYNAGGAKFTTFAYSYIRGYVLRYITKCLNDKSEVSSLSYEYCEEDDVRFVEDTEAERSDIMNTIFGLIEGEDNVELLEEYFVKDKSFRQIAKEVGISHVSVANRVNSLLDILEKRLKHENA